MEVTFKWRKLALGLAIADLIYSYYDIWTYRLDLAFFFVFAGMLCVMLSKAGEK